MVPVDGDLATLYESAPCGLLTYAPDGTLLAANRTFLDWLGYARQDLVGRLGFVDVLSPGSRLYHETHYAPLLRMQGEVQEIAFTMVAATGARLPVLVNSRLVRRGNAADVVVTSVFKATDRRRYEQELMVARRVAEEARSRLALVHAVTDELAAAGDVEQVSEVITRAGTEAVGAACCALWLRDDTSHALTPRAASGLGAEPPRLPLLPLNAAAASDARLLAGEVVSLPLEQSGATFPLVTGALGGDGSGHLVLAPIVQDQRLLAVLACRFRDRGPVPEPRLELIATLVGQAALAIPRARLFEQQRDVAQTLQRSLLPAGLPEHPGFELAHDYRPAGDGEQAVGGDWYDAFQVDGDRLAVVVGDVVGRGVHAAAAMGQLRSAIRALASVSPDPVHVLEGLDDFVEAVPAASSATTVYALLEVRTGRLRYSCAGHPPPVLVDAAGSVELLWGGRSVPLGVRFAGMHRDDAEVVMPPGSRLLMYTDGLVERRDVPLDVRIDELTRQVAARTDAPPRDLVRQLAEAMVHESGAPDDVCLLCLARTGG